MWDSGRKAARHRILMQSQAKRCMHACLQTPRCQAARLLSDAHLHAHGGHQCARGGVGSGVTNGQALRNCLRDYGGCSQGKEAGGER